MHRTLVAERVYQIDAMRSVLPDNWITRPMYELDLARLLRMDQIALRAAEQPDFASARAMLGVIPAMPYSPPRFATTVPA